MKSTRGLHYEWSKSLLVLAFFPFPIFAATEVSETPVTPIVLDPRVLVALVTIAATSILIPFCRYVWVTRVEKKSFLVYVKTIAKSTLDTYGHEHSISFVRNHAVTDNPEWLIKLENENYGAPNLLINLHQRFIDTIPYSANKHHYPIVKNAGLILPVVDHDNPLWRLDQKAVQLISRYLVAQKQVNDSIESLYSKPLFDLLECDERESRERWVHAGIVLVEDLAELYMCAKKLTDYLNTK